MKEADVTGGRELLLGIDGGSSKTAGVLIDGGGAILATARGAGSIMEGRPEVIARSHAVLAELTAELCRQAHCSPADIVCAGLGLCGIDFADQLARQQAEAAAATGIPAQRVVLVNDAIVGLWGASPKPAAALIQHGSGFTAAYRARHGEERLFDHLSVAAIYDMRRGLVPLVARMLNGMEEPTPLREKVLAHFGVEARHYCDAVYRGQIPADRYRTTVSLIFEAWLAGDAGAARLVTNALEDYALAFRTMIASMDSDAPDLALGGGVLLRAPERFRQLLAARLHESHPKAVVKRPDLSPEFGAAMMAAYHAGRDALAIYGALRAQRRED